MLRASELADKLNLTKGRISQLVSAGKLNGCFDGDGANRRFDLGKCAQALGRRLDQGQMLGNGAKTRKALRDIVANEADDGAATAAPARERSGQGAEALKPTDTDRYELARAARAEEDLRSARLRNGREEGLYVLRSEVEQQVSRVMGQELRETETFLKDSARKVADAFGVDFKVVRKVLMDAWREHRSGRSEQIAAASEQASMTDAEKAAQI